MNIDELPIGRDMNNLIADKVMGWVSVTEDTSDGLIKFWRDERGNVVACQEDWGPANDVTCTCWSPSTDIRAAWQVVEKLAHDFSFDVTSLSPGGWRAAFAQKRTKSEQIKVTFSLANTVPLAICRAALKVVME